MIEAFHTVAISVGSAILLTAGGVALILLTWTLMFAWAAWYDRRWDRKNKP